MSSILIPDEQREPGEIRGAFADRHIGASEPEQAAMLAAIGYDSLESLVDAAVPAAIRDDTPLALERGVSESEAILRLRMLGSNNEMFTSLIGLGYSDTVTPLVILRNVLENPAWYTAYTPYQPEISQGRLEALVNFQTMVTDLTGMEIANASMLDEATAAAEAMALLYRVNGDQGDVFLVDSDCLPQTIEVVRTRAEPLGIAVVLADPHGAVAVSRCERARARLSFRHRRRACPRDTRRGGRRLARADAVGAAG
jgi:glycine dehydrogenase